MPITLITKIIITPVFSGTYRSPPEALRAPAEGGMEDPSPAPGESSLLWALRRSETALRAKRRAGAMEIREKNGGVAGASRRRPSPARCQNDDIRRGGS